MKYKFSSKVWRYPGDMAWYFVNVPHEISEKIREKSARKSAGMVKVVVEVNKYSWSTSLFWSRQDKSYLLPLKVKARKEAGIMEGDKISVTFSIQ